MKGITKEVLAGKLIELRSRPQTIHLSEAFNLLEDLIEECTELNPWQPIDESTPKDRQVLLHRIIGTINQVWVGYAFDYWPYPPTHWQERPEDPK